MRLVFVWFFAVLLFVACDNTTANKNDTDTLTDQPVTGDTDDIMNDQTDQSDPTVLPDDPITDDIVTDNPVTDDSVDESTRPDGDTIGATCATIEDCSVGMFCKKSDGDCTGSGVCDIKPDDCTGDEVSVCGCDGQSYTNECWANNTGVNVLAADVCPTPTACSGDGVNGGCADPATYCRAINDACGGEGFCELIPLECPDWDYPVCACDDKTYPSRCHAEMQKQGILHDKECGSMSPCTTNDQCAETEFCAKPFGTCDTSTMGKCDNRPTDCEMTRAVAPQCGCDDYTYSNQCWAAAGGAVIAHEGECDGDVMCWGNDECQEEEFCYKKTGVCDMGFGVCRLKPTEPLSPPEEDIPVCGCDGQTYWHEIYAFQAGVSVKHEGECNGPDDSQVRYFFADNAETPDGYLRIVVSPTDIREFWTTDTFIEQFNGNNSVTLTVRFYESDIPESDYAELQYTLSLPTTLPMGIGFGYEGAYLKWYTFAGVEQGEMVGTVITYEYVRLDAGNEVSTLIVSGLNLSVKE